MKSVVILILSNLLFSGMFSVKAQNIELNISGIRSEKGQVIIGVFRDNETFRKETPYEQFKFEKSNIFDNTLKLSFSLEPGLYGFTLLDDENSNGLMDYSFMGIPKEGFGFSGYDHKGMRKPHFDSFKYEIRQHEIYMININVKYF